MRRAAYLSAMLVAFVGAQPLVGQDPDLELHGFVDFGTGARVSDDPLQPDDVLLSEARFRLDLLHYGDRAELSFKGDLVADGLSDEVDIDIRQAVVSLRASNWLDVRAGRQVLTWGTGDLVFLNDLFPKDFVSFFVGREDEFLKAPANALRLTFYSSVADLDVVATPVFEPDRYITGERLSYFDAGQSELVSAASAGGPLQATDPTHEVRNGELAWRLYRNVAGYELAVYGYLGFAKQPLAFDPGVGMPRHSRLGSYGASARGALAGGIVHLETSYYDHADDVGDDPFLPNSQWRALAGYEHELRADVVAGVQYYMEHTLDHDLLLASSSTPQFEPSRTRHVLTGRLTYRMLQQTLTASLFGFVSPNDGDSHVRPSLSYALSDAFSVTGGANVMLGDEHTFFGQLADASNVYLRGRYSF